MLRLRSTAISSTMLAKFSSVTIAPSMARTKIFSRKRGMYCRMPRRSVGFISMERTAAGVAARGNVYVLAVIQNSDDAERGVTTAKGVFTSAPDSMQFSHRRLPSRVGAASEGGKRESEQTGK